jgi:hypothetical protein
MEQELEEQVLPRLSNDISCENKQSNKECLREYEVNIRFFNRGCLVRVGCKEIAFEKIEDAMKELNEYVTNTYDVQEKWRKILY